MSKIYTLKSKLFSEVKSQPRIKTAVKLIISPTSDCSNSKFQIFQNNAHNFDHEACGRVYPPGVGRLSNIWANSKYSFLPLVECDLKNTPSPDGAPVPKLDPKRKLFLTNQKTNSVFRIRIFLPMKCQLSGRLHQPNQARRWTAVDADRNYTN